MTGDDIGRIVRLDELDVLEDLLRIEERTEELADVEDERGRLLEGLTPRAAELRGYVIARLAAGRAERTAVAVAHELDLTGLEFRAVALVVARRLLEEDAAR